jgi:chromosome segregation ATPase
MSLGFGFSVGDFIAGIQLVRDVISSLQSSAGSALEYQTLIAELFTLERALLEVKALRYEDCDATQLDALKCAATQCQSTIDKFLAKVKKYQPSLNAQGSSSKVKDSLRKIQWALCEKADLETFKAEVRGHAGSINMLLATLQM